jgi:hypothetical protein
LIEKTAVEIKLQIEANEQWIKEKILGVEKAFPPLIERMRILYFWDYIEDNPYSKDWIGYEEVANDKSI